MDDDGLDISNNFLMHSKKRSTGGGDGRQGDDGECNNHKNQSMEAEIEEETEDWDVEFGVGNRG